MEKAKRNIVKYVPDETVINKIYMIRGQKVMLDFNLAVLYEVTTKALNQAVKRNVRKFPAEFVLRLTKTEWMTMRSQIVTTSQAKRNINVTPYAFTEHGVAMVANVLKSERAIRMSIFIVKTFIHFTKQILDHSELAAQIKTLRQHLVEHDVQLNQIYDAIENLLDEKAKKKSWEDRKRIGFK